LSTAPHSVADIRAALLEASGARLERLLEAYAEDERAGVVSACTQARARAQAASAEAKRTRKLYALQRQLAEQGYQVVAGLDEVGRGALAGPVSVGAVVLPLAPRLEGLDDSKRLTAARREELAVLIHERALAVSIAHVPASDIDAMGMGPALRRAFQLALNGLPLTPDHIVIDGLPLRLVEYETAVVKGDSKVASIAAASIVAKVARDALMRQYATVHPEYGFEQHKGYGSAEHMDALARVGACELHRMSFTVGGGTMSLF